MALTEAEQIAGLIKESNRILITFKKDPSLDAIASSVGLYHILKKQSKVVDIACDGFIIPDRIAFLPHINKITPTITSVQKFVISVDTKKAQVGALSYHVDKDKLLIYLSAKSGSFIPQDVSTESTEYTYDLIITIDTPDLASLGNVFNSFADFFYDTTIINIDHHVENEQYGQINLINPNAVASSEMVFRLINTINKQWLDVEAATCLLTGLIAKTHSFKTPNVTPKTLEIASALMEAGANKDTIIQNLYRSRALGTLNLWGRVLAKMKSRQSQKLIWAELTEGDFLEANARPEDLPDIVEELIAFMPGVEAVALLYQQGKDILGQIHVLKHHNALFLGSGFNAVGNKKSVTISLPETSIKESEQKIIEAIEKRLIQSENN